MPALKKAALGASDRDLVEAVASGTPVLALRFEEDLFCPAERLNTVRDIFGPAGSPPPDTVDGKGHSVLTANRDDAVPDRVPPFESFFDRTCERCSGCDGTNHCLRL